MKPDPKHFYPIAVEVEEGKTYYWCSCGESETEPFCDRTDCGEKVVSFHAQLNETIYFCACKHSKDPPFCDGSHAKLMMEYVKKKDAGLI